MSTPVTVGTTTFSAACWRISIAGRSRAAVALASRIACSSHTADVTSWDAEMKPSSSSDTRMSQCPEMTVPSSRTFAIGDAYADVPAARLDHVDVEVEHPRRATRRVDLADVAPDQFDRGVPVSSKLDRLANSMRKSTIAPCSSRTLRATTLSIIALRASPSRRRVVRLFAAWSASLSSLAPGRSTGPRCRARSPRRTSPDPRRCRGR